MSGLTRSNRSVQPDPQFESELENQLMALYEGTSHPPGGIIKSKNNIGWWLGLGGLVLALLIGLAWLFGSLTSMEAPITDLPESSQPTGSLLVSEPAQMASPVSAYPAVMPPTLPALRKVYALAIQPDVDFSLEATFPENLPDAALFRQAAWEPVTVETARTSAAQLGVQGSVYFLPNQQGDENHYLVWDGLQKVTFFGSPRSSFLNQKIQQFSSSPTANHPACQKRRPAAWKAFCPAVICSIFLTKSGSQRRSRKVEHIVQLLNEIPLLYRPGNYQGEARVGSDGELLRLDYHPIQVEEIGRFPILSARQAWETAAAMQTSIGMHFSTRTAFPSDERTWLRTYPLDESVELFGSLQLYPSAEGGVPLVLFDGFELKGSTQGMEKAAETNSFVQVWGHFVEESKGSRFLQVDGWQRSAFPSQTITGTINRQEGQAQLDSDGMTYLLPDLPADIPEGQPLAVSGVVIEGPQLTLDWSAISNPTRGSEWVGGPGFFELDLSEGTTSAASDPAAVQAGQGNRWLEALLGLPQIVFHQYPDGSTTAEVILKIDPGQDGSDLGEVRLEGPGLEGIEAFHNLPVRTWGSIVGSSHNIPVLNAERIEPVYPGLKNQAWLGRYELETINGLDAVKFTSHNGEQFFLDQSGAGSIDQNAFGPGDPVVVEGYLIPDQQSPSGAPIIHANVINPAQGMEDLSGYVPQSITPLVIKETGSAGARKKATITAIELAYATSDPRDPEITKNLQPPYVQPVWRFSGTFDDGSPFEILIQALDSRFLIAP